MEMTGARLRIETPGWADRMGSLLFDAHENELGKDNVKISTGDVIKECRKIIKSATRKRSLCHLGKIITELDLLEKGYTDEGNGIYEDVVLRSALESLDEEYKTGWHAKAVESGRILAEERSAELRFCARRDFKYTPGGTDIRAYLEFKTDHESRGTRTKWNYRMKKHAVEQFFNAPGEDYGRGRLNNDGYKIIFGLLDDAVYCKGARDNPRIWIGEHRLEGGKWRCGSNGTYPLLDFKKIPSKPGPPAPPRRTDEEIRVGITEDVLRMKKARGEGEALSGDDIDDLINHAIRLSEMLGAALDD